MVTSVYLEVCLVVVCVCLEVCLLMVCVSGGMFGGGDVCVSGDVWF